MLSLVIFNEMLCLISIIFLGYFCAKRAIITSNCARQISSLIVNVLNPGLIISSALHADDSVSLTSLSQVAFISCIMFLILIVFSKIYIFLFQIKDNRAIFINLMMVFSNLGFIGIPIVQRVYGPSAVINVSIFMLTYSALIYTYGITIIQRAGSNLISLTLRQRLKIFFNPGVISCIISVLLALLKIPVPQFGKSSLEYVSMSAIFLSLMMVGVSLSRLEIKSIFNDMHIWFFSLVKMILLPFCIVLIRNHLGWTGTLAGIFFLMISMPVGNMPVLLSMQYGIDASWCSKGVALTTLMALITLPIVSAFILF
ncbi:UNVERIFIED_ORG: putative permease [Rahnella aquatilis]